MSERRPRRKATWDARAVRELRSFLGLTQQELAEELGTRQQTISEWETGQYRPRGASATLLTMVAEQAGFRYQAGPQDQGAAVPPKAAGAAGD